MGNIDSLNRSDGSGNPINDLVYIYKSNSNLLDSVYDAGSQNRSGSFSYDGNGNMVTDTWKGITIKYNYLNLPDTVTQGNNKLVFIYDAAGNKLYKQLIINGTIVSQRHYVEDEEVTASSSVSYDGKVESVVMPEGRILTNGSNYQYEYQLIDHLGNNRVTFRPNADGTLTVSNVENYYPFGQNMGNNTMNYATSPPNNYLYNNKELQPELNLNTYDFGARHYDATLGRWTSIDPLAEIYNDLSPYNYVDNNPMNLIDPDGMGPIDPSNTCYEWGSSPLISIGGGVLAGASAVMSGVNSGKAFGLGVGQIDPNFKADVAKPQHNNPLISTPVAARDHIPNVREPFNGHDNSGNVSYEQRMMALQASLPYKRPLDGPFPKHKPDEGRADEMFIEKPIIAVGALILSYGGTGVEEVAADEALTTRFITSADGSTVDLQPTLDRIASGEKFPHRNDGSIFRNTDGLLPKEDPGYYKEYVHPTTGVKGPGAQRIVTGKNGNMWFTPDHYKTFIKIR